MAYKLLTIIQGIVIIFCGLSMVDFPADFGLNKALFGPDYIISAGPVNKYWNFTAFIGYCFLLVALLQIIKGLTQKSK